jgi:hypothetical protein
MAHVSSRVLIITHYWSFTLHFIVLIRTYSCPFFFHNSSFLSFPGSLLYNFTPSTQPLPAFSPSLFSHVPPAIRFCQHNEACRPLPECVAKLLKWRYTPITPLIIRKTVVNSGFKMTKRKSFGSLPNTES